jgi:GRB2-associated-binding protein 1
MFYVCLQIYFYEGANNCYIPFGKRVDTTLQYIDLDLETDACVGGTSQGSLPCTPSGAATATVYKTVDFIKTEAFNRTRQKVEEERKQCVTE